MMKGPFGGGSYCYFLFLLCPACLQIGLFSSMSSTTTITTTTTTTMEPPPADIHHALRSFAMSKKRKQQRPPSSSSTSSTATTTAVLVEEEDSNSRSSGHHPYSNNNWVSFSDDYRIDLHNTTIDGQSLPGPFYDNKLYLLGARLVTSRSKDNNDNTVKVMLFGQAGHYWKGKSVKKKLRCNLHHLNHTLLPYKIIQETIRLQVVVQQDGKGSGGDICPEATTTTSTTTLCRPPINMELIENISVDYNVNNVTVQWIADITSLVTKEDLLKQPEKTSALRLAFHISEDVTTNHNNDNNNNNNTTTRIPLLTVDIPLWTGVVGHAGPQIRSQSFLTQSTVDASICVATYGQDIQQYLPQFVLHHLNVGFGQIIVAVDTTLGSNDLEHAKRILHPFLQDGSVVIAATGLPGITCDPGKYPKIHFYNTCLHYSKGFSNYLGIWDIDEFWMPPSSLITTTTTTTSSKREAIIMSSTQNNNAAAYDLWKESNYSTSPSISQAMAAIQSYQEFNRCGEQWCFHTFPSYIVFRKRNETTGHVTPDGSTTGLYSKDFRRREDEPAANWHKSILRTEYTNIAGIHQPGSCRFPQRSQAFVNRKGVEPVEDWYPQAKHDNDEKDHGSGSSGNGCWNLHLGDFGMVHHFASLAKYRSNWESPYSETFPVDEYVEKFGQTVEKQLSLL